MAVSSLGITSLSPRVVDRPLVVRAIATPKSASSPRSPRPQNVPGDLYVDHTCIDCDTCRWMAPSVFSRMGDKSAVHRQPSSPEERVAALQALLACPTASIHTKKPPADIKQIQKTFPLPVDEQTAPGVYHCGYHSDKSFGGTPYLLVRPDGNILIDSPKFTEALAKEIERMGAVRYMFLSHKDDVADHKKWQQRFQCERILHTAEIQEHTSDVEIKLEGNGPWNFIGPDVEIIHTPGHTEGHICLLYKPKQVLFTGDHLFADLNDQPVISHKYLFYSVQEQVESIRKLLSLDFVWVLPGHGRRLKFKDVAEKNTALQSLISKEEQQF